MHMGRIIRIIVWGIIVFSFFYFISSVYKSCSAPKQDSTTIESEATLDDSLEEDEYSDEFFEDEPDTSEEIETFFEDEVPSRIDEEDSDIDFEMERIPAESNNSKPSTNTSQPKSTPPSTTKTPPPSTATGGKYFVITGSFLMKENADKMISKLNKLGYRNAEMVIFESSQYHTVTSGRYGSKSDADSAIQSLKNAGIDCYAHTIK